MKKWEEIEEQKPKKRRAGSRKFRNKEFARVTYFFVILFLALIGYLVYFQVTQAEDIVNSPYNARQDNFAKDVVRGSILDQNGVLLAETQVGEDGSEVRVYPYGSLFAHVLGYSDTNAGKAGLESAENFSLLTSNAFFVEKIKKNLQDEKNQGDTLVTTLRTELQQSAYEALGNNRGAVVILEPSTGRILAMVSKPDYDPNAIGSEWQYLNSDEENSPLLNRATQGLYAPGSIFKLVTTLAYMRQDANYGSYTYQCSGQISLNEVTIHCFDGIAHGLEDLGGSVANSCNTSFANIGLLLDKSAYRDTAEDLLFNRKLPCTLDYEKSSFQVTEDTSGGEMMMTAMGQGNTLVSPYHMALLVSAIANQGVLMEPYLVEKITNYTGTEISKTVPKSYRRLLSETEAAQLSAYMQAVVNEGTGTPLSGGNYTAAGKTGTAEYSMTDGEKTHSWFVGYTNVENPELAISVVLEQSDGTDSAVSVAKKILDTYYGG